MRKYFYTDGVTKFGPYSKEELKTQKISRSTKIWYFGLENWTELSQINELDEIISTIPPDIKPPKPPINEKIKNTEIKPIKRTNPLSPITNAGWCHGDQYRADLQSRQAISRA